MKSIVDQCLFPHLQQHSDSLKIGFKNYENAFTQYSLFFRGGFRRMLFFVKLHFFVIKVFNLQENLVCFLKKSYNIKLHITSFIMPQIAKLI